VPLPNSRSQKGGIKQGPNCGPTILDSSVNLTDGVCELIHISVCSPRKLQ